MKALLTRVSIFLFFLCSISAFSQNPGPVSEIPGVKQLTIHSEVLGEDRLLYIYHPINAQIENLPVLYILDGQSPNLYQEALDQTEDNPHILVGVVTRQNRNRDMIPENIPSRESSGGSENFLKFLMQELIPYVNYNFQTSGHNILYGASNSGLFTVYALLAQPESFSAYIASSPMIGHCKDFMIEQLELFNQRDLLAEKTLYIHWGMKDHYTQVTEDLPPYIELLKKDLPGLKFGVKGLENEGHVPMGGITEGLNFIYKK